MFLSPIYIDLCCYVYVNNRVNHFKLKQLQGFP